MTLEECSTGATEVPDVLDENLKRIDEILAKQNIPLTDRPIAALNQLLMIGAIMKEDGTAVNSEPSQVVDADWFVPVMKWITTWYRLQYGDAVRTKATKPLTGFILIRRTPFLLKVPPQIVRPGKERGTAWLHLVDRVLDEENALEWVHNLPIESDPSERESWKAHATAIAANLRFIQNRVVSLKDDGEKELLALAPTIVPHFGQAAKMITSQRAVEIIQSYWELQMAAEAGFKSLLFQQTGSYPHTHDLIKLSTEVAKVDTALSTPCLGSFPHWKEAVNMRYGQGNAPSWEISYRDYQCILATVRECVARWKRVDLSDAQFLLKKPAWT